MHETINWLGVWTKIQQEGVRLIHRVEKNILIENIMIATNVEKKIIHRMQKKKKV